MIIKLVWLVLILALVPSLTIAAVWASTDDSNDDNGDSSSSDVTEVTLDINYTRGDGEICLDDDCQEFVIPTDPREAFDRTLEFPSSESESESNSNSD